MDWPTATVIASMFFSSAWAFHAWLNDQGAARRADAARHREVATLDRAAEVRQRLDRLADQRTDHDLGERIILNEVSEAVLARLQQAGMNSLGVEVRLDSPHALDAHNLSMPVVRETGRVTGNKAAALCRDHRIRDNAQVWVTLQCDSDRAMINPRVIVGRLNPMTGEPIVVNSRPGATSPTLPVRLYRRANGWHSPTQRFAPTPADFND